MSEKILCLLPQKSEGVIGRHGLECLTAAKELKEKTGGELIVGCIGTAPVNAINSCSADRYLVVEGDSYVVSRYSTDIAAGKALVEASGASVVIVPACSRGQRFVSGLAARLEGAVDTHATQVDVVDDNVTVTRWYYRQRMEANIQRKDARPWVISLESGCYEALVEEGEVTFEQVEVESVETRTVVKEVESTSSGDQTIRPDSDLLFVAGAGWTKKQGDGSVQAEKASGLILDFIQKRKASLGSSKSMVDLSSEGQAVLPFLTHLHQVGQTGSTPRHSKGLATCCHGEEPHAVGWRFVQERRAINLDANCGWAHGKADVLYIADSFEVMQKVNEKLG